jgi:transmembrane sensor
MQQVLAWRTQRVEFTDTPLHELIAVFNARNTIQLAVATPDVAELRISGVFRVDDPDAFARLVAASAELQLGRGADGVRVLRR